MIPLDNMLVRITQQDVVYRYYLLPEHRSFIPDFGVFHSVLDESGKAAYYSISRQLVMFCVERRKAWRMLQSKAGIVNREYQAQKAILAELEAGKISKDEFFAHAHEMMAERLGQRGAGEGVRALHQTTIAAKAAHSFLKKLWASLFGRVSCPGLSYPCTTCRSSN